MATDFINDGYTRQGFIKGDKAPDGFESLWNDLTFEYRTAVEAEIKALDASVVKALNVGIDGICRDAEGAVKAVQIGNEFMAKHLKSWDYRDPGNHLLTVTPGNMAKIFPNELRERLYLILRGDRRNDTRPEATAEPPTDGEQLGNSGAG